MHAILVLVALAVEAVFGYPHRLYRVIGHPVSWIGRLLAWSERRWNTRDKSFASRRAAGVAALALVVVVAAAVSIALVASVNDLLPPLAALIVLGIAASAFIAQRSLHDHVRAVAEALETGMLDDARHAVSQIVGRDTKNLDAHAIGRAAIESLSENFSDGIAAPVFWMVVAGLPGAAIYKAINTADSMIGHKTERHLAFGWAAARLDDVANLPAARLSVLWIASAASLLPDASGRNAFRSALRDARRHTSPNAGWPEAAMAGALGLKLAGPRTYDSKTVDAHWMGDGRAETDAADIRRALRVYRTACLIQAAVVAAIAVILALAGSHALT